MAADGEKRLGYRALVNVYRARLAAEVGLAPADVLEVVPVEGVPHLVADEHPVADASDAQRREVVGPPVESIRSTVRSPRKSL